MQALLTVVHICEMGKMCAFGSKPFQLENIFNVEILSKMNAAAGSFVLHVSRLIKNFFRSSATSFGSFVKNNDGCV